MKTGIVDVGGGLRGIYAAGYLTGASTRRFCLTCASAFRPEAQTWFLILRDKGGEITAFMRNTLSERNTWG